MNLLYRLEWSLLIFGRSSTRSARASTLPSASELLALLGSSLDVAWDATVIADVFWKSNLQIE